MNVAESLAILQSYSTTEIKFPQESTEKENLKNSIVQIASLSDWQNLGICSNTLAEGLSTLEKYLSALGYKIPPIESKEIEEVSGVYIKYNTRKMTYIIEPYLGEYRGVLISYQGEDQTIARTYGYFPLDLF